MSLFLHNCLTKPIDDFTDLQLYVTVRRPAVLDSSVLDIATSALLLSAIIRLLFKFWTKKGTLCFEPTFGGLEAINVHYSSYRLIGRKACSAWTDFLFVLIELDGFHTKKIYSRLSFRKVHFFSGVTKGRGRGRQVSLGAGHRGRRTTEVKFFGKVT